MVQAVTAAANAITAMSTGYPRPIPEEKWEEYADAADNLLHGLRQLNSIVNIEYPFEDGLPDDIVNYAALLNEYQKPLDELVGFLLTRDEMFGGGLYKYETMFLEDVLAIVTTNANVITGILAE